MTPDLYRANMGPAGLELRAIGAAATTMAGHFAVWDQWTEIDSWVEGRFLERLQKGAFKKTIRERRAQIKVTFDHGYDPTLADKPLGPIEALAEDDLGVAYSVPLLDTDYVRAFVLPALEGRTLDGRTFGSLLGASFRFRVTAEKWDRTGKKTPENPEGLAMRTITELRLFEFGPVVYPAYAGATAGVRSLTDHYTERQMRSDGRAERAARALAQPDPAAAPGTGPETDPGPAPATLGRHASTARAAMARLTLTRS